MRKNQYLLLKLMEECAEVTQRASKQIQFGALEVQSTHSGVATQDNAERLTDEIIDLIAVVRMLLDLNELAPISPALLEQRFKEKKIKMQKYLDYSADLGELPEIKL